MYTPKELRIVERWERDFYGKPVCHYIVELEKGVRSHSVFSGGFYKYWQERGVFDTLKEARTYLKNLLKPLPADKILDI